MRAATLQEEYPACCFAPCAIFALAVAFGSALGTKPCKPSPSAAAFPLSCSRPCPGPPGANNGLPTAQPGGSGGGDGLLGWQVALIVIACVVFVGALAGVISWSVVRKLRKEVEAVKSGSSDKDKEKRSVHSGNGVHGSGSNEGCSGPGENGSRGVLNGAGSGGELANNQGTPKALGGGGGGARPSDDSSMAADKPPLEVLNAMMNALTNEMDDQHLTILEVIGQGGFGVVYKGMWKGLLVAVKTITFQDRVVGGEKGQHRAILEAAISSSLAHVSAAWVG